MNAIGWTLLGGLMLTACGKQPPCERCDTLVIAATGEPSSVFPPLVGESVARLALPPADAFDPYSWLSQLRTWTLKP